jgi:hypothetical protein
MKGSLTSIARDTFVSDQNYNICWHFSAIAMPYLCFYRKWLFI